MGSPSTLNRPEDLDRIARHIRRTSLEMVHRAKLGHPGGDLSAADILTVLFFRTMRYDPERPQWSGRDRFILSKGHCSAALYATLAEAGFFPREQLTGFMQPLSMFNGHPD